jgi:hypothetical protein
MLHDLQAVKRIVDVPSEDRLENDLEHSYLLAMAAWYAIDTFKLPLDRDKAIPEVYAGDTYVFSKDTEALSSKKGREAEARLKLRVAFPTVPAMHEAMDAYEAHEDDEAIFVRALDKVMPIIAIYLADGRGWKREKTSFDQVLSNKRQTTARCPEVQELMEEIMAIVGKDRQQYFGEPPV